MTHRRWRTLAHCISWATGVLLQPCYFFGSSSSNFLIQCWIILLEYIGVLLVSPRSTPKVSSFRLKRSFLSPYSTPWFTQCTISLWCVLTSFNLYDPKMIEGVAWSRAPSKPIRLLQQWSQTYRSHPSNINCVIQLTNPWHSIYFSSQTCVFH
jgi:hypothetical protein